MKLSRMFLLDTAPLLILALLMAIALGVTLEENNPVRARKRFAQLEARTFAGEVITCAEIYEPSPIRPPTWLS